ncbi:hypothetical protein EVAR_6247_1 [Eumeta japonica]|uniref:Uncharacterized protein n=1 Tax=Eumeta variegata TaxID=151549 RepID=A0A4C1TAT3_EUMVA|nr:hypothetical protein EVAR_6247_1 [Eumeta japonica]
MYANSRPSTMVFSLPSNTQTVSPRGAHSRPAETASGRERVGVRFANPFVPAYDELENKLIAKASRHSFEAESERARTGVRNVEYKILDVYITSILGNSNL